MLKLSAYRGTTTNEPIDILKENQSQKAVRGYLLQNLFTGNLL